MIFNPYDLYNIIKRWDGASKSAASSSQSSMDCPRMCGPKSLLTLGSCSNSGRNWGVRVDTLTASRHANMKELRISAADGEWRVAFAFDTKRKAILRVAGDKSGGSEKRFYKQLITKADDRFDAHLVRLKKKERK